MAFVGLHWPFWPSLAFIQFLKPFKAKIHWKHSKSHSLNLSKVPNNFRRFSLNLNHCDIYNVAGHDWKCFLANKIFEMCFFFLFWFYAFVFFAHKNLKKIAKKVAHNQTKERDAAARCDSQSSSERPILLSKTLNSNFQIMSSWTQNVYPTLNSKHENTTHFYMSSFILGSYVSSGQEVYLPSYAHGIPD